jgi:hypothetical protein
MTLLFFFLVNIAVKFYKVCQILPACGGGTEGAWEEYKVDAWGKLQSGCKVVQCGCKCTLA